MKKKCMYLLCAVFSGCMVPGAASSAGAGAGVTQSRDKSLREESLDVRVSRWLTQAQDFLSAAENVIDQLKKVDSGALDVVDNQAMSLVKAEYSHLESGEALAAEYQNNNTLLEPVKKKRDEIMEKMIHIFAFSGEAHARCKSSSSCL